MSRLAYMLLLCVTSALAQAPNRGADLDKAYEEARAAFLVLQDAERRRDAGVTPESGDRQATAAGSTRPTTCGCTSAGMRPTATEPRSR